MCSFIHAGCSTVPLVATGTQLRFGSAFTDPTERTLLRNGEARHLRELAFQASRR